MEDCEGGFVEILRGNKNAVYRFNVSVNEGFRITEEGKFKSNHTIWVNAVRHKPNDFALSDSVFIYNNTAVINKPFESQPNTCVVMDASNAYVYNNIFSSTGNGPLVAGNLSIQKAAGTSYVFTNNLYEGNVAKEFIALDKKPILGVPNFLGEGDGKMPYRLSKGSPALGSGANIQGPVIPGAGKGIFRNLSPYPTVDFYGNAFDIMKGKPGIGAYSGQGEEPVSSLKNNKNWLMFVSKAKGIITINCPEKVNYAATLSIIGTNGNTVWSEKRQLKGEFTVAIPSEIPQGVYTLRISGDALSFERMIILTR